MGKSYANFMCKKFFHPSSFANIKRVWLAEQRVADETKKQEELRAEYERDQDHYTNRQLMGDERVKHGLTFIYEPPKAYQKEASDTSDGKLEWKRATPITQVGPAPAAIQPSSAAAGVKKVRCMKCQEMGHVPTDKECPLYDSSREDGQGLQEEELVEEMRRDGLAFKQNVLGRSIQDQRYNKDLVSDSDCDAPMPEEEFLKSLTKKQKKKLLKKLNRMEKNHSGSVHKKGKHRRESKKKHRSSEDDSSDGSSDDRHGHRSRRTRRSSSYDRRQQPTAKKTEPRTSSNEGIYAAKRGRFVERESTRKGKHSSPERQDTKHKQRRSSGELDHRKPPSSSAQHRYDGRGEKTTSDGRVGRHDRTRTEDRNKRRRDSSSPSDEEHGTSRTDSNRDKRKWDGGYTESSDSRSRERSDKRYSERRDKR